MVKHHTEAKDKQTKLKLDTAESTLSSQLERDAGTALSALQADTSANFDREYIQTQIKEHQQVLEAIDRQLLPNAKGNELKAYLKEIRPTVETHLKDAREIESKLSQQATASSAAATPKHAATPNQTATPTPGAPRQGTAP